MFSVRLFKNAIEGAIAFGDSIEKASVKTGFSIQRLQELRFAGDQAGLTLQETDKALAKFTKRLGLARKFGKGAAAGAFEDLGVNIDQDSKKVFEDVVKLISEMKSETDALAVSTEFFGENAQKMYYLIRNGNEGLAQFAKQAHDLGLILSDDLVTGAADAADELSIVKQVLSIQFTNLFLDLAPAVISVASSFVAAAQAAKDFGEIIRDQRQLDILAKIEKVKEKINQLENQRGNTFARKGAGIPVELELEGQKKLLKQLQEARKEIRDERAFKPPSDIAPKIDLDPTSGTTGGKGDGSKEVDKFAEAFQSLLDKLDPVAKKTRELEENIGLVNRAFFDGLIGAEKYDELILQLTTDLDALEKANKALADDKSKALSIISDLDPVSGIRDQIIEVQRLQEVFADIAPAIAESLVDVEFELQDKMDGIINGVEEKTKDLNETWQELGGTFASAFEDAIVAGASLQDILSGLEQDIIRILTRKLVTEPLTTAFSDIASGLFSGGGGNPLAFLTGKAAGGPVMANQPYVVGEKGAELFVPKQSGTIIPAGASAGGTVNIYQTVGPGAAPETFRRSARQGALEGSRLIQTGNGIR